MGIYETKLKLNAVEEWNEAKCVRGSVNERERAGEEVGLLLLNEWCESMKSYKIVIARGLYVKFKLKKVNLTVVVDMQCVRMNVNE